MPRHITPDELARLRAGSLEPAEALRVLEHRAACAECRAETDADAGELRALLEFDVCPSRSEDGEQRLVDYVVGRLDADETAELAAHVESCAECSRIVAELREDQAALRPGAASLAANVVAMPVRSSVAPRAVSFQWWRAAMAAVFAVAMVGVAWMYVQGRKPVDQVSDGGVLLALNRSGEWNGWTGTTPGDAADRDLVLAALRSGRLPKSLHEVKAPAAGELRGEAQAPAFELLSPMYTRVEPVRPKLSWKPLANAKSYQVVLFSMDLQVLEMSPALPASQTSWEPTKDLPRGQRIGWQVSAERTAGDPVLVPAPPAPPMFFEVIDSDAARRIASARAANPTSHLLLAALFAREGMNAEARAEAEALAAANPKSASVQKIVQQIP